MADAAVVPLEPDAPAVVVEIPRHCTSPREEWWNALSHGLGALGSAFVFGLMLMWAWETLDVWKVIGVSVFGVTLTALLATSAVYHGMSEGPWKDILQTVDHSAIFVFIAGSYTPFALVLLEGNHSLIVMLTQWGVAALGIAIKVVHGPMALRSLGLLLYVGMGFSGAIVGWPVFLALPWFGIGWLLGGGALYLLGVAFYLWESLPFNHFYWHLFVLGGAACHAIAVLGYVAA